MITDGENGLLIPVGNETALTDAMNQIVNDPSLTVKLSRNAAALRKRVSASKICSEWMQVIGYGE